MKKFFLYASIGVYITLFPSLGKAANFLPPAGEEAVMYVVHPEGGPETSVIGDGCEDSSHTPYPSHKLNKCTPVKKVRIFIYQLRKYE